jgi:hypothetical protein
LVKQETIWHEDVLVVAIKKLTAITPIQRTKQLVECRLKALSSIQKLEIFSVRFDEGERKVTPLLLSNILQSM